MPRLVTQILLAAVCTSILVEASANQAGDECNDQTSLLQLSSRAHSAPVDVEGDTGDNSTTNGLHMPGSEVGHSGNPPKHCSGAACELVKVKVVTHPTKDWHACGETIPVKGSTKPLPARGLITCCNGPAYMFDQHEAHMLVKRYLRFGGRFIDTAPGYGNTQRAVGPTIEASGIPRAELWLQSKIETAQFLPSKGSPHDFVHHGIKEILKITGVSYMDSIVLHLGPGEASWEAKGDQHKLTLDEFTAMWRGLMDAKQKGKVHNIGVGETTKAEIEHLIKETGEVPAIVMAWWHPWMPKDQKVYIDWLKSKEIAVQAYGLFNTIRHDPVMRMRATDAALRHQVTWGQLVIKMALDMGIAFSTSYHGGYWQEDLKCLGFQPEAKDREILAVTPRWTCSHGLMNGQILSGCGAPTTQELAKESLELANGANTRLSAKLVKLEETQSKLKAAQKFLADLAKKTADKEEALYKIHIEKHKVKKELKKGYRRLDVEKKTRKERGKLTKEASAKQEAKIAELAKETDAKAEVVETLTLSKAHLKGEVKLGLKGLIDAEAKALKLSEEATVNQEAFDQDVDALGTAALTASLRLSDMVMAQKNFAESERKFAKLSKDAQEKHKTDKKIWQDLTRLSIMVNEHKHLAEVAHRASIFSQEVVIKEKAYVNKEANNAVAQKEVYQKYAKLTALEKLEEDLKKAKEEEADNRKRLAEAQAKQHGIDQHAAKLQKKAAKIKTNANEEAHKIVERIMKKATKKANTTIAAVKPETNKKEETAADAEPAGDKEEAADGEDEDDDDDKEETAADAEPAGDEEEAAKGEDEDKDDDDDEDKIERYCHKEWQALVLLMQRDPWATICLSGDPRYTKCRQHSVHCKDYSPLRL